MWSLCRLNLLVCGLVFCLAATGTGVVQAEPERETPQYGGTINIATRVAQLNALTWNQYKWQWKFQHDGLFADFLIAGDLEFGPRGTGETNFHALDWIREKHYRGAMAESWSVEEDPLRLVFNIRPGMYWPQKEGVMQRREVVAEDVAFNFNHMASSPRKIPTWWGFIREWKAEGKYKAVAYLNEWNANLGYRLLWGYYGTVSPPEVLKMNDGEGSDDWRLQTGSGPYKLVNVRLDDVQVYERNAEYWDKEVINGVAYDLPYNDGIVYNIIPDESAQIAALRTCKIDVLEQFRWQFAEELRRSAPELILQKRLRQVQTFVALRNDQPPFDDIRVRRAMNLAVDQQEIVQTLLNGDGVALDHPFSVEWEGYYTALEDLPPQARELFEYHPEKAKELLAQAGYPDGFEFEITFGTHSPYHLDLMAMLEAYYQRIGVKVVARAFDYPTFLAKMRASDQTAGYLMDITGSTPFSAIRKSFITDQTWNPAFHSDEWLDQTYFEALGLRDKDKRDTMLRDMNHYLLSERVPVVWLPSNMVYAAWWPYVKNYWGEMAVGAQSAGPIYARMWIDQELKQRLGCD